MRIHRKTLGIYIIILAGLIAYIGFTVEESNILVFGIPDPRTLQPLSLQNPQPFIDISCYLKTKVFVLQLDGSLIAIDESPYLGDIRNIPSEFEGVHPLLSTIVTKDPKEREADAFQVYGKLRCPQIDISNKLILEKTTVELRVYSQDSKQNRVLTHQSKVFTIENVVLDGITEKTIFIFQKIKFDDILAKLDSGAYDSWHEFDVQGTVAFHWEGVELLNGGGILDTLSFRLYIPMQSINTFIQTTFVNNVGTDKPSELNCQEPEVEINGACQIPKDLVPPAQTSTKECKDGSTIPISELCPRTTQEIVFEIVDEWTGCLFLWDTDCLQESRFFGIYAVLSTVGIVTIAYSKFGKTNPMSVRY